MEIFHTNLHQIINLAAGDFKKIMRITASFTLRKAAETSTGTILLSSRKGVSV